MRAVVCTGFGEASVREVERPTPAADEVLVEIRRVQLSVTECALYEGRDIAHADSIADAAGHRPLVVVATMGAFDVSGILAGLQADADYIGLVASRKRAGELIDRVAELADVEREHVAESVTTPAGLDIGAKRPAEIALSIVAELVAERDGGGLDAPPAVATADAEIVAEATDAEMVDDPAEDDPADAEMVDDEDGGLATDPVCGMRVDPATASATATHAGETYYFCCQGCADSFSAEPESYLDAPEGVAE